LHVRTIC